MKHPHSKILRLSFLFEYGIKFLFTLNNDYRLEFQHHYYSKYYFKTKEG